MSVFKRTPSGDLDRGENNRGFSRVRDQDEAATWLDTILKLAQGEVKRDSRVGLDHRYLFDPLVPTRLKANHIAATMVSVPGVTDAQLSFTNDPEIGRLSVQAEVTYDQADQAGRNQQIQTFLVDVGQDVGGSPKTS